MANNFSCASRDFCKELQVRVEKRAPVQQAELGNPKFAPGANFTPEVGYSYELTISTE